LFAEPESSLRGKITYASLKSVLAHIEREAWPADFVSMTGDVSQDETAASYSIFEELFSAMDLPVHCVPGNHDDRELMRSELSSKPFYYCDSTRLQGWLVVGVDSCLDGEAGGNISSDDLACLERSLQETTAEHIIVCLHHPPLPVGSHWLDQVGLHNGEEYLDLLAASGKVRTTIFGHVHQAFDATHKGIRVLGTPSTCRQFKVASDKFALDILPPAYRRICLYADGTVDTELLWVDDD
jgi:Icc protein